MKRFLLLFIILLFCDYTSAASINSAAYRTMQMQSYRNNYNRQINNAPMPYWQAQSNFSTRNKVYSNYQNYAQYNNAVQQYNYNTRLMRYQR